jgi:hypothetical protein
VTQVDEYRTKVFELLPNLKYLDQTDADGEERDDDEEDGEDDDDDDDLEGEDGEDGDSLLEDSEQEGLGERFASPGPHLHAQGAGARHDGPLEAGWTGRHLWRGNSGAAPCAAPRADGSISRGARAQVRRTTTTLATVNSGRTRRRARTTTLAKRATSRRWERGKTARKAARTARTTRLPPSRATRRPNGRRGNMLPVLGF